MKKYFFKIMCHPHLIKELVHSLLVSVCYHNELDTRQCLIAIQFKCVCF